MYNRPDSQIAVVRASAADDLSRKINIIFMLSDDLGWGDFAYIDHLDIASPTLDRMAADSMLFEQFCVNVPLFATSPGPLASLPAV